MTNQPCSVPADLHRAASGSSATATTPVSRADSRAPHTRRRVVEGSAAALLSLFLIGTAAPVASVAREIPVLVGQGLRYAVASLIMIIIFCITRRLPSMLPSVADLPRILLLGSIGVAGFTTSYVYATHEADPALVGSVVAATPVLLSIIGPLQRRRRPNPGVLIGAVIVAAGTMLAAGAGSATPLGLLLALGALTGEVIFTLSAVQLIAGYGSLATTLYASVSGGAVLILVGLAIHGADAFMIINTSVGDLSALLYLALLVSIGANLSWYTALPRLGPDRAGLFYAFTPIGALVAGLLLGASSPRPLELTGLGIMIIGLLVGLLSKPEPATRRDEPGVAG